MTKSESQIADQALHNLEKGGRAFQVGKLPAATLKNASSALENGAAVTEKIAAWIRDGFVAGPFSSPPLSEFRSNSMMVDVQKGKPRIIINMSYPKKASFNDNVDTDMVQKLTMSSARQFGQAILQAGQGSIMSKVDMKDAYKLIPAASEDLRLQGFKWLGAYFVETQQIFGAATSPANFDQVAATILTAVCNNCSIPRQLVHRTLDDVACVAPKSKEWCQEFTMKYKNTCAKLGIQLAPICPKQEKAFENTTRGTVLGIKFDTERLAWSLSSEKMEDILSDIFTALNSGHLDLKQMERLNGRLNNLGQMCPFLQAFKRPLNQLLANFKDDYSILLPVSPELASDLKVWAAVAIEAGGWLPIYQEMAHPPLGSVAFTSDAAGCTGEEEWTGVAAIGLDSLDEIWFCCRGKWPSAIKEGKDEKGADFKSKMTTLELIGLFLPLLCLPSYLAGKNVILKVDNTSVIFGWENKCVKGDVTASALVKALHIVASFLPCRVFVHHSPRVSDKASRLADSLSRASTSREAEEELGTTKIRPIPAPLGEWLKNPATDWQLGFKLVDWLKLNM